MSVKVGVGIGPLLVVPVVSGLILLVAAACGGGNSSPAPTGVNSKPGATGTPAATSNVKAAVEIDQKNLTFIPARVTVKVGDTVLIKNSESAIHTGNINGKNITGNMKKGDSTPWLAKAPGEYKVTCDYHPQMSATIVVS